ncbi:hypothetical protein J4425_02380 [Candidatus Woesearchaeota archaeon]|nr:hypothetical protein [Candidatus Woesearchaeota archaeon]
MASFEDFKKIELKVGEIKEVKDHPKADKLYVLRVDTGEERTLVAGIRNHYSKDDLIGKKIIVVVNLEEKELRGVKSQGMLLAASDDEESVVLLTVDKDIKNGSGIS